MIRQLTVPALYVCSPSLPPIVYFITVSSLYSYLTLFPSVHWCISLFQRRRLTAGYTSTNWSYTCEEWATLITIMIINFGNIAFHGMFIIIQWHPAIASLHCRTLVIALLNSHNVAIAFLLGNTLAIALLHSTTCSSDCCTSQSHSSDCFSHTLVDCFSHTLVTGVLHSHTLVIAVLHSHTLVIALVTL